MSEKISILALDKKVKKEINLGEGIIEVYFPTNEQIKEIQEYFTKLYNDAEDKSLITIDSREMLFYIIPMLTNLDYKNIEDETIAWSLIDNPPYYLQLVKAELREIMQDINYLKVKETGNQLKEMEMLLTQADFVNRMPEDVVNTLSDNAEKLFNTKTLNKANKIIELSQPKKTEDELKIEELEKQLNKLKNKKQG